MPLSPSSNVVTSVGATFSIIRQTCSMPLARGHDAVQRRVPALLEQATVFGFQRCDIEGSRHDESQRVCVDRLLVKIVGAEPDRLDGIVLIAVTGDDDDLRGRRKPQDVLHGGKALTDAVRIRRQSEVLQNDGGFVAAERVDGAGTIFGKNDLVVLEAPFELALQPGIVFDDKQFPEICRH